MHIPYSLFTRIFSRDHFRNPPATTKFLFRYSQQLSLSPIWNKILHKIKCQFRKIQRQTELACRQALLGDGVHSVCHRSSRGQQDTTVHYLITPESMDLLLRSSEIRIGHLILNNLCCEP
ncbi:hypothetical protein CEXT_449161 [Caerostris extrusa]|uniref:Uncharacterized protein n=1 Tax=Caerostris extrusa TaxID=172846 RepID=A0AAV4XKQ7_CAEEX|nr:hypothetical protein CEXT_449161 [Caerostris extrusa]